MRTSIVGGAFEQQKAVKYIVYIWHKYIYMAFPFFFARAHDRRNTEHHRKPNGGQNERRTRVLGNFARIILLGTLVGVCRIIPKFRDTV